MTDHSARTPQAGRTWGSALIIAGTTIGAGMLAMPLTSAGMGFGLTTLALLSMWALSAYTALQFAEVYRHHSAREGLASLAGHYFGPAGKWTVTAILLLFMYAISAAYVNGGGGLLGGLLPLGSTASSVLYALLVAAAVLLGTRTVDGLTRVLFALKLAVFGLILALVLPRTVPQLLLTAPQQPALYFSALPIFFTAFGFHAVIPSVTEYLEGDQRELRRAIVWGTGLPLAVYLLWQLAIHGLIPQAELLQVGSLDELSAAVGAATGSAALSQGVRAFSALALTTSVLGVGLALLHLLRDVLGTRLPARGAWLWLGLLTFVPPTLLATLYPQGFVALLGYAGLLAVLYTVLLPGLLVLRAYRERPGQAQLPGGRGAVWLSLATGAAIILIPLLMQAGLLPKVQG
ncbi:Tryptophan/tyrosine permease (plasmid) [Deinococcus proteolyticus MRP]|uniref:Tryptophan/tyrosine permease n=1 Tax=Deinococcus proteolyticus (strain ATCC 35074 / DSM 20540 / JCM 6276 / NBRC 101906 / NCIMB 13154 / VKM Ac-1939 / CCM 2703 / MRP) TaxID=693977 RepID=F0RPX4_DEIPM|nr:MULTISPECIES: aromatic amino acid transport family protein [Deinococcus]ADY27176.1 Tryptophan/tyrosine permease [Deinococcus proteolyticus MRP]MCY1704047.1 tryptophan/tyrosine permease [Deinococcus sp. SL84]